MSFLNDTELNHLINSFFNAFVHDSKTLFLIKDEELNIIFANDAMNRFHGFDVVGKSYDTLLPETQIDEIRALDKNAFSTNYSEHTHTMYNTHKKEHQFNTQKLTISLADDKKYLCEIYNDITDLQIDQVLVESIKEIVQRKQKDEFHYQLGNIIDHSDSEVYIIDIQTKKIIYTNETVSENLGYDDDLLKNMTLSDFVIGISNEEILDNFEHITNGHKEALTYTASHLREDGTLYHVETKLRTIELHGTQYLNAISVDITERKEQERKNLEELRKLAITDPLTNLYNRRYLDDIFPHQLSFARRYSLTLGFFMLDIDYFKQYNDHYGHQAGDQLLQRLANLLNTFIKRSHDYIFRIGGEEFCGIVLAEDRTHIINLVYNIHKAIEELKIENIDSHISKNLTVSMGLFVSNDIVNLSLTDVYKMTDDALYQAKHAGRNQVKLVQ
jgi:diguanylate cyclase (GGDEF)-like protein/PAS domain S-box-containing protein